MFHNFPGGADWSRGPDPRGATRSQHADQWLREPDLQVLRGQRVDSHFTSLPSLPLHPR